MPLDIVNLLKSDVATEVASRCQDVIDEDGRCTADCAEVARRFQSEHCCYPHFDAVAQRPQPRHQGHALVSLQGVWFGLYPASGVELVEVTWDAGRGLLLGTKLTGNQFVRAGRVSWESAPPPPRATARAAARARAPPPSPTAAFARAAVSQTACRVVSSVWAGAYTPRWDPCRLRIGDADHVEVVLPLGNGEEEVLAFVRATAPLLLEWEDESSPARGFMRASSTRAGCRRRRGRRSSPASPIGSTTRSTRSWSTRRSSSSPPSSSEAGSLGVERRAAAPHRRRRRALLRRRLPAPAPLGVHTVDIRVES